MRVLRPGIVPCLLCLSLLALTAAFVGCTSKPHAEAVPPAAQAQPPQPSEEVVTVSSAPDSEPKPETSKQPERPEPSSKKPQAPTAAARAPEQPATSAETPAADVDEAPRASPEAGVAEKQQGTVVVGKIELVSQVPDPSTVPYKDCVTFIKYRVESVESGEYEGEELLAVFWGMREAKLQPAAGFSVGQRHRLTIEPFSQRRDLARVMQADDTNEYSLTPYWVINYTAAD